jgi:hypothetical protein
MHGCLATTNDRQCGRVGPMRGTAMSPSAGFSIIFIPRTDSSTTSYHDSILIRIRIPSVHGANTLLPSLLSPMGLFCRILFLVLWFTLAPSHPATLAVLTVDVLFGLVAGLLDPYTAVVRKKQLDDGSVVPVVRPLIGFQSHESKVGVTGGMKWGLTGSGMGRLLVGFDGFSPHGT